MKDDKGERVVNDPAPKPMPCPWCQQSPSGNNFRGNMQSGLTRMFCEHCGAEGPSGSDKENAMHWWNRRPNPETQAVAQLEVRNGIAGLKHLLAPIDQVSDGMMLYRSHVEAVPALKQLEADMRSMAACKLHLNAEASEDLLTQFADRLSAVIRGTKT